MAVTVSTKHFRIMSFLQRSTDVPISDNSQKLLANTSAHCKRKTDTNTKYMPSSLSNSFFSLFPYFSQLNSFYLFYSIFSDLLAPNIMQLSPRAQYSLQPSELCSRIQQPPLAPYQNITVHLGCSALSPDAKNLPL